MHLNDANLMGLTPFNLSDYQEAVGDCVVMRFTPVPSEEDIHVAYAEALHDGTSLTSLSLPTNDTLPPLYFYGAASIKRDSPPTALGASAFMYGVVRLTTDSPPQVRWSLTIRYDGSDKWRMQGVQVGGVGSVRGWVGVSTHKRRDMLMVRLGAMVPTRPRRRMGRCGIGK